MYSITPRSNCELVSYRSPSIFQSAVNWLQTNLMNREEEPDSIVLIHELVIQIIEMACTEEACKPRYPNFLNLRRVNKAFFEATLQVTWHWSGQLLLAYTIEEIVYKELPAPHVIQNARILSILQNAQPQDPEHYFLKDLCRKALENDDKPAVSVLLEYAKKQGALAYIAPLFFENACHTESLNVPIRDKGFMEAVGATEKEYLNKYEKRITLKTDPESLAFYAACKQFHLPCIQLLLQQFADKGQDEILSLKMDGLFITITELFQLDLTTGISKRSVRSGYQHNELINFFMEDEKIFDKDPSRLQFCFQNYPIICLDACKVVEQFLRFSFSAEALLEHIQTTIGKNMSLGPIYRIEKWLNMTAEPIVMVLKDRRLDIQQAITEVIACLIHAVSLQMNPISITNPFLNIERFIGLISKLMDADREIACALHLKENKKRLLEAASSFPKNPFYPHSKTPVQALTEIYNSSV